MQCLKKQDERLKYDYFDNFYITFHNTTGKWMVLYQRETAIIMGHSVQKLLRYKHHKQNYIRSLDEGIIPTGLRVNKKPATNTVPSDFHNYWKTILSKAEKDLVQLLLVESYEIIAQMEIQSYMK